MARWTSMIFYSSFMSFSRISRKACISISIEFKYILIDEFQDTNPAQYEIIKLLGAVYENVWW